VRRALWLLAGALGLAAPAAGAPVSAVGAIGFTVADADRTAAFLERVLDFEKVSDVEVSGPEVERLQGVFPVRLREVRMRLGEEELALSQYLAPAGRPVPPDARGNDLFFQHAAIVVSDMQRAYARLRAHKVAHASSGPQRLPAWNESAAGIEAFYFRDPDGHFLELIHFPPGKGDPRWQQDGGRLFLGIDHTALVVSDTEASLRFWRDALGLRLAGESENHGPEQERLNAVFGARLRITTLRAARGPGVELLEYRAPGGGRARPGDARANDLLHWQTDLVTSDVRGLARRLAAERASFDSPGEVTLADGALGFSEAALVADPDGHRVRVVEKTEE
jgi:catechol 2,3-dioxygenase-like lactoylglutathione lyase family enzyme